MKQLDIIISTITNFSATKFANEKLHNLRISNKEGYYEYMRDCYSGKGNPSIEECEHNAFICFVKEYGKCCEIYAGWLKNGKVFILDRRDKIVSILYKNDGTTHMSMVHYNPLNVDLIEQSCSNVHFFKEVDDGRYELLIDEDRAISECDELINHL